MAHESETLKFLWVNVGNPLRMDAELVAKGVGTYNKILPPNHASHYFLFWFDVRDNAKESASDKTIFRETINQIDIVCAGTANDNIIDEQGTQRMDFMLAKVRAKLDEFGIQYDIKDDDFSDTTDKTRKIITFNYEY
jgi:hypothetical protein